MTSRGSLPDYPSQLYQRDLTSLREVGALYGDKTKADQWQRQMNAEKNLINAIAQCRPDPEMSDELHAEHINQIQSINRARERAQQILKDLSTHKLNMQTSGALAYKDFQLLKPDLSRTTTSMNTIQSMKGRLLQQISNIDFAITAIHNLGLRCLNAHPRRCMQPPPGQYFQQPQVMPCPSGQYPPQPYAVPCPSGQYFQQPQVMPCPPGPYFQQPYAVPCPSGQYPPQPQPMPAGPSLPNEQLISRFLEKSHTLANHQFQLMNELSTSTTPFEAFDQDLRERMTQIRGLASTLLQKVQIYRQSPPAGAFPQLLRALLVDQKTLAIWQQAVSRVFLNLPHAMGDHLAACLAQTSDNLQQYDQSFGSNQGFSY